MDFVKAALSPVFSPVTLAKQHPIITTSLVVVTVTGIANKTLICKKTHEAFANFNKLSDSKKIAVIVGAAAIIFAAGTALGRKTAPTVTVDVKVPATSDDQTAVSVVPVVMETHVSETERKENEAILAKKEQELVDAKATLAKKEQEIADLKTEIQKKDNQLTSTQETLAEAEAVVAQKENELTEIKASISQKEAALAQATQELQHRANQVAQAESSVEQQQLALEKATKALTEREKTIAKPQAKGPLILIAPPVALEKPEVLVEVVSEAPTDSSKVDNDPVTGPAK